MFSPSLKRRYRRIGLMAGAVAFLCQVMAWTVLMPAMSLGAEGIPVCTADGVVLVSIDEHGQKTEKATGTAMLCPLCPLIAGMAPPPPPVDAALPADIGRQGPLALPGGIIAAGWFLSSVQARAPPLT